MFKWRKKAVWRWLQVHLPDGVEFETNLGYESLKDKKIIITWSK